MEWAHNWRLPESIRSPLMIAAMAKAAAKEETENSTATAISIRLSNIWCHSRESCARQSAREGLDGWVWTIPSKRHVVIPPR